jgi:acylphosphatase
MDVDQHARLRMIVVGRVQGVFFRRAAADEADRLAITGCARNLADGTVEIVAEGRRRHLERLLAWVKVGPPHARVDDVRAEWSAFSNEFIGFKVR